MLIQDLLNVFLYLCYLVIVESLAVSDVESWCLLRIHVSEQQTQREVDGNLARIVSDLRHKSESRCYDIDRRHIERRCLWNNRLLRLIRHLLLFLLALILLTEPLLVSFLTLALWLRLLLLLLVVLYLFLQNLSCDVWLL